MPSQDSKKLLVIAHNHNKDCSEGIGGYFIVVVKKLTEENTGISNRAEGVQFSPDGKFLTAVDDESIIFNSNKYAIPSRNGLNNPNSLYYFNAAEAVNPIIISPNDQKFAYVIQQTIISEANPTTALYFVFVNINSEKFDSYDQIFMKPIFSKDSSKIMYPAQKGNNFYWIVNNTQ